FVGLQAVLLLISPHDVIRYFTHAVNDPKRIGTIHWSDNQALNGLVLRLTDGASWSLLAALAVGLVLAPPAVLLMRRFQLRGEPLPALLVTAFYGLLISPVSWTHHWVWAVPLLIVLLVRARWWVTAALTVVFASYLLLWLPGGRDPDLGWSIVDHVLGNLYLYVPLVLGGGLMRRRSGFPRDGRTRWAADRRHGRRWAAGQDDPPGGNRSRAIPARAGGGRERLRRTGRGQGGAGT